MPGLWSSLNLRIVARALTSCGRSWAGDGQTLISDSFNRIYWLKNGRAEIEHDGELHRLKPGQLHVIPSHSPGRYRCVEDMDLYWCHFNASLLGGLELFEFAKCELDRPLPEPERKPLDSLWKRLIELGDDESPSADFESLGILASLLSKMLAGMDKAALEERNGAYERFAPVFDCMDRRLGEKIKVSELAELAHLQENYFSNLFHKHFGLSPMACLKLKRIRKAQSLLREGESSLKKIAEDCGFGSPFHFSMAFKNAVGIPPGAYRKLDSTQVP